SIDLDAGSLTVRESLQRIDGKLTLVGVKTDKSRRTISLPRFAMAALRTHRSKQAEERLVAGSRWRDNGLVFASTIGTPLDRWDVHRRFKTLLMRAEIPPKRFHDLRHYADSRIMPSRRVTAPSVALEVLPKSA